MRGSSYSIISGLSEMQGHKMYKAKKHENKIANGKKITERTRKIKKIMLVLKKQLFD